MSVYRFFEVDISTDGGRLGRRGWDGGYQNHGIPPSSPHLRLQASKSSFSLSSLGGGGGQVEPDGGHPQEGAGAVQQDQEEVCGRVLPGRFRLHF